MRRVAVLAFVVALGVGAGACGGDERFLPPGQFAGSDRFDKPVKLVVADKPQIDGQPAEWIDRGSMRERARTKEDKDGLRSVVECVVRDEGEELSCTFSVFERPDIPKSTIELVRL